MLGLLDSGDDQSGYDLLRRIDRSVGYMWAPAKTGLYTVLGRLEAAGLLSSTQAKGRGPTKALYRLTVAGRYALHTWISDPAPEPRRPRDPFLLKLHFARRAAPEAALTQVQGFRTGVARLLAEWEEQEREPETEPLDLITLRYAILRARATLAWCDETLEILREATT